MPDGEKDAVTLQLPVHEAVVDVEALLLGVTVADGVSDIDGDHVAVFVPLLVTERVIDSVGVNVAAGLLDAVGEGLA